MNAYSCMRFKMDEEEKLICEEEDGDEEPTSRDNNQNERGTMDKKQKDMTNVRRKNFKFTVVGNRLDAVEETCELADDSDADGNKVNAMRKTRSYDLLNNLPDEYSDPEVPDADRYDDDDLNSYESDFMEEMMAIHNQMVRRTQIASGNVLRYRLWNRKNVVI